MTIDLISVCLVIIATACALHDAFTRPKDSKWIRSCLQYLRTKLQKLKT